jgi:hypothetical protein
MAVVRYSFTLDAIKDADLVRRLAMDSTTEVVRAALRAYYNRPSHQDIDAKLDVVLDCLRGVQVVNAGSRAPDEAAEAEPATARRGLDAMRRRFREKDLGDG